MSVSIPREIKEDWRSRLSRDDAKQRKIKMKNIARDNKEANIIFQDKQAKLLNNTVDVFPNDSLGEFIQEQSIISGNARNDREKAQQRLRQISANLEIADYILERLSQDEINYLLVNFNKILTQLKKTSTKLDKDLFISMVQREALENPVTRITPSAPASPPDGGNSEEKDAVAERVVEPRRSRFPEPDSDDDELPDLIGSDSDDGVDRVRDAMEEETEIVMSGIRNAIAETRINNRLQQQFDERLLAENDAAPTRVGTNQGILNAVLNPTTPENLTISPANTPRNQQRFTPEQNRARSARLRRSSRARQTNRKYDDNDFESNLKGKGAVISGRGLKMQKKTLENREYLGNFYVEKNKLKDNILSVKYAKTEVPPSQLRPRSITTALRELIEDVLNDKYNERMYKMLPDDDKRAFKKFVKVLKLPIDTYDDLDKEYQKNYELLKGQFMSGNNSPEVKNALRKYIIEGMNEGKLNRSESMFLLYQLSLDL